jgi:DNA modification methylase
MKVTPRNEILIGDALQVLSQLRTGSVDAVVTSPPWYGQRDYGVDQQMGREGSVDEWADRLALVLSELHRVTADHGSVWFDLGDTYSRSPAFGARPKSLLLAPERLALRAVRAGWILRNKLI